jgi:Spy/CpxP family protein refolding chaperone
MSRYDYLFAHLRHTADALTSSGIPGGVARAAFNREVVKTEEQIMLERAIEAMDLDAVVRLLTAEQQIDLLARLNERLNTKPNRKQRRANKKPLKGG